MKIVPAILTEKFDEFVIRLKQAESFTDYVQIDLMDGAFVPSHSIPPDMLNSIRTPLSFEIHLMVKNPFAYMSSIFNPHLKKVIFHFESDVRHIDFIDRMKKRGLDIGMAVKPETEIEEFKDTALHVGSLLFLTVTPGFYGSSFRPEVMEKIRKARELFKGKILSADGGVSLKNLKLFLEAGLDYVCVGSRIFVTGKPEENYEMFVRKLNELEVCK